MVGVDENAYSDYALQWLLRELVDDGDEIICVRVIEKEARLSDKQYQDDAQHILQGIMAKNEESRALSFVLEYAVGKLHATFQKLVSILVNAATYASVETTTNFGPTDSYVRTRHADRWHKRQITWWYSRLGQHAQFVLEILLTILSRTRRSCPPRRETT